MSTAAGTTLQRNDCYKCFSASSDTPTKRSPDSDATYYGGTSTSTICREGGITRTEREGAAWTCSSSRGIRRRACCSMGRRRSSVRPHQTDPPAGSRRGGRKLDLRSCWTNRSVTCKGFGASAHVEQLYSAREAHSAAAHIHNALSLGKHFIRRSTQLSISPRRCNSSQEFWETQTTCPDSFSNLL